MVDVESMWVYFGIYDFMTWGCGIYVRYGYMYRHDTGPMLARCGYDVGPMSARCGYDVGMMWV